jgi:mono/diheme cytochrome c family protein
MDVAWLVVLAILSAFRAPSEQAPSPPDDGAHWYRAACASCHGPDGRGQPRSTVGFSTPLPDFTDCAFATPEPDADWIAIVHQGGPTRAFDRTMPAFGEALSDEQIQETITYLRSLCTNRSWPRGELNLPRPLLTEKAFPENEAVLSTTVVTGDSAAIENELLFERRLGTRSQFEVVVPVALQKGADGGWERGLGDAAFAFKHVLFHSLDSGSILSAATEVVFPTGKEDRGLGKGATVVEPFVAFGQVLPSDGFVQLQGGAELSMNRSLADHEVFWRAALGKSFTEGRFGRSWSPMIEVAGAKALDRGEPADWDVVPQMQVTISRRQHIMVSAGLRVPVNNRRERDVQVLTYFLWDWVDGGLFDGWR